MAHGKEPNMNATENDEEGRRARLLERYLILERRAQTSVQSPAKLWNALYHLITGLEFYSNIYR